MTFGDTLIIEGPRADTVRLSEDDDILSLQGASFAGVSSCRMSERLASWMESTRLWRD